ncbi:vitrin isoform X2 [Bos mutus]|uniref:vitrin isoform X2 n=1 Tax=Bos mutus TaxID=72004 RepID=UPI0038B537C0
MGIVVLTMKASVIEMFLVLLVTGIQSNQEMTKKMKRPKFTVPQISCDVRAGKITNVEFIVKCPPGCQDPRYHVYGADVYASYSSVCGAAVHSGVLDNSGGKILVRKVAGQSGYKGSYSNGVQSLSLPRWRESFVISGEPALWKPESVLLDAGFVPKEELSTQSLEPASQGDPSCKVDLSFLIDGSSSIGKRRFRIQKQFLTDVAQTLDIGPAGPLMGVVQYGDNPATQFNLKTHMNSQDVKAAIEKISQRGGLSNAGRAISFVTKNFFSKFNGNRGGAPNVAVVMVDGWPTDKVEEASRLARESGINIFFITIEGASENEKQYMLEPNFANKAVCRTNGFYSLTVQNWFSLHKTVQPLVKRVCDTDRLACSKTCLNSADIGFVIDGSSSVGTSNFRTVLQFVANLSREFEISDTDTRIGAMQYTYEQRLEFGFDEYSTKSDVLNAIKRVGYWSGGTSTGAAIHYALEQLFKKSKPNKRKLMILITDGRSYDDIRIPAMLAHHKGVITYAIGVAWAAQDELDIVATHPARDHAFFVDEFDNLYKVVPKVIQNICTEFNSQPRN